VKPARISTELWLEPQACVEDWCALLGRAADHATLPDLSATLECVSREGGLHFPLGQEQIYVFLAHPDLEGVSFEDAWAAGQELSEKSRYASALDVYMTRTTVRDIGDITELNALEEKVQLQFTEMLPQTTAERAIGMMERFADPQCLSHAQRHPSAVVQQYAREQLEKFAAEGDPFSAEILERWSAAV
jgi:hypothetical protein